MATRTNDPRISIVIPVKNEARNLELILPELPRVYEVILVDGHSTDGSVDVARRVLPEARILNQTRRGKGNALASGFEAATGDVIVMFDADGSADPAELPRFIATLISGADFAKGSRFCAGGGSEDITRFRRLGNFGLNLLANVMLQTRYTDLCYGYNAFWTDVLADLNLPSSTAPVADDSMIWGDGFEIETVINCRIAAAGLVVTEVPSYERSRIHGMSNLNAISDGIRVLKTIARERRRARATKASTRLGAGAMPAQLRPKNRHSTPDAPALANIYADEKILRDAANDRRRRHPGPVREGTTAQAR